MIVQAKARNWRRAKDIRYTWHARHDFMGWTNVERWKRRLREILSMPRKGWKGRIVLGWTCNQCGRVRWEGEWLFWHLVSLQHFRCAWCAVRG